jgi:hypothetical protein
MLPRLCCLAAQRSPSGAGQQLPKIQRCPRRPANGCNKKAVSNWTLPTPGWQLPASACAIAVTCAEHS